MLIAHFWMDFQKEQRGVVLKVADEGGLCTLGGSLNFCDDVGSQRKLNYSTSLSQIYVIGATTRFSAIFLLFINLLLIRIVPMCFLWL